MFPLKKITIYILLFGMFFNLLISNPLLVGALKFLAGQAVGFIFSEFVDNIKGISNTQLNSKINSAIVELREFRKYTIDRFRDIERQILDIRRLETDRQLMYRNALLNLESPYLETALNLETLLSNLPDYLKYNNNLKLKELYNSLKRYDSISNKIDSRISSEAIFVKTLIEKLKFTDVKNDLLEDKVKELEIELNQIKTIILGLNQNVNDENLILIHSKSGYDKLELDFLGFLISTLKNDKFRIITSKDKVENGFIRFRIDYLLHFIKSAHHSGSRAVFSISLIDSSEHSVYSYNDTDFGFSNDIAYQKILNNLITKDIIRLQILTTILREDY